MRLMVLATAAAIAVSGCGKTEGEAVRTAPKAAVTTAQSGNGAPYVLTGTQVWDVPDPVSGRKYQIFVNLPASYEFDAQRRYPVLYVTDADYAFPVIRSMVRRLNLERPRVGDFILVGLSYAQGDSGSHSRRRDYTPTPKGPSSAPADAVHGGSAAYRQYIREQVLPFVEGRFRADPESRVILGHSYGGLLGAEFLLQEPGVFSGYILGSPSFWYDKKHMLKVEADYAKAHKDLPGRVFMYVGGYETVKPDDARYNNDADLVGDMRLFETNLKSRGYPGLTISSEVLPGEDHLTVAPSGFARGLMAVLPPR
ncbi:alpha/beta hydrolase [Caulobacter sp. NIBR2454]|uniref:alpha/beta hydrolase n=1 Tax=Caulobacter sp. NIBR2454 TaxID=3015996 RepID=UPI0022B731FB|nr:alpha/beta hydrolase-fold protein [Caulobacter sp. NIBR2454]